MLLSLLLVASEQQDAGFDYKMLLPFAVVLLALLIMPRVMRRNREERRKLEKQITREMDNRLNVKSEADKIMVDIVEMGREINARLDNKIRLLNKLIKDADTLVDRLEQLKKTGIEVDSANYGTAAAEAGKHLTAVEAVEIKRTEDTQNISQEQSALDAAESAPAVAESSSNGSGRWKADMRQRIAGLSAEGRDAAEIARITRMSVAEVSLMLELIRREN